MHESDDYEFGSIEIDGDNQDCRLDALVYLSNANTNVPFSRFGIVFNRMLRQKVERVENATS